MTDESFVRRWDPSLARNGERWVLAFLSATDKNYIEGAWYVADNKLEIWRGSSPGDLQPEQEFRSIEFKEGEYQAFTAPFWYIEDGEEHLFFGYNSRFSKPNGSIAPHQKLLYLAPGSDKPIELDMEAPPHTSEFDVFALRDPYIIRKNDEYIMYVTVGGCRWGTPPQIQMYKAKALEGPWVLFHGVMARETQSLFGQFERHQIHEKDGKWYITFSAAPNYTFLTTNHYDTFVCEAEDYNGPFKLRAIFNLGCYGPIISDEYIYGWKWTNPGTFAGDLVFMHNPDPLSIVLGNHHAPSDKQHPVPGTGPSVDADSPGSEQHDQDRLTGTDGI